MQQFTRGASLEPPRATVLLVEQDAGTAERLTERLERRGYRIERCASGREARALVASLPIDIVVLDLILPDVDGLVMLGDLRSDDGPPIVVLSRTQRRGDAVLCFRLGADDFFAGDIELGEVEARIDAVLRRVRAERELTGAGGPERLEFDGLQIDVATSRVHRDGVPVELTPIEFRLLVAIVRSADRIISRKDLVGRLRRKLSADGRGPTIVALRLQAFRLVQSTGSGMVPS